jgi:hypothetical protein
MILFGNLQKSSDLQYLRDPQECMDFLFRSIAFGRIPLKRFSGGSLGRSAPDVNPNSVRILLGFPALSMASTFRLKFVGSWKKIKIFSGYEWV